MNPRELCEKIQKHYLIYTKGKSQIVIDGHTIPKNKLKNHLSSLENPIEIVHTLVGPHSESLYLSVFDELKRMEKEKITDAMGKCKGALRDFELDPNTFLNYKPVKNLITSEVAMLCSKTGRISDIAYDSWKTFLPQEAVQSIPIWPCITKYNPYDLEVVKKVLWPNSPGSEETIPALLINEHIPPQWRYEPDDTAKCPLRILRFLNHLFPKEECRDFFLNWLRNAILSRNNTNLVLNSVKGTGKNILVEDGIFNLFGSTNCGKAHRAFLTSNFNSVLLNKRIILLDEQRIDTPDKQDKIKDYSNPQQNVERKGKDADSTVETFHSFILLNNRETDIKLEQDDRRYSVMDMAEVRLDSVMSESEIRKLIADFRDPVKIHSFGNWILHHCEDDRWSTESAYKGDKFKRLIEVSLWEWQTFVLEAIISRKEDQYDLELLKSRYKRVRSGPKSSIIKDLVMDFLKNYKHEGKDLGSIEKVDDMWVIIPSKHYLPDWAQSKKEYKVDL